MKAIIIDDEPRAIELLKGYLIHFSNIELVGTFRNGLKAFEFLSNETIDLIFLDINMPHISGITLSKMLDGKSNIIFTTAYSEFAVESYELKAIDYLLKPISLERFTKAISKVLVLEKNSVSQASPELLILKSGNKIHRVNSKEIKYIEKDGNYATYFLKDKKIVTRESVAEVLSKLSSDFFQVHKTYVVNSQEVSHLDKESLNVQGIEIPIGASFKDQVFRRLVEMREED